MAETFDDKKLDAIIIQLKQRWARIFTTAIQRQAEGSLRNIRVVVDPENKIEETGFLTLSQKPYGVFQDLGTGRNSGNPNKNRMYKEAKTERSRISPPKARRFSRGNTGGIRASFYQSIPANLYTKYFSEYQKLLTTFPDIITKQIFPNGI